MNVQESIFVNFLYFFNPTTHLAKSFFAKYEWLKLGHTLETGS